MTRSIKCWKVAGALQSPNGITLNAKRPSVVQNAVLLQSILASSTCQYPLTKSKVLNHCDPANVSSIMSIRGRGRHLSLSPYSVCGRPRSLMVPSFLVTNTIREVHGLLDRWMVSSCISPSSCWTSFLLSGGIRQIGCQMGEALVVVIS